jgi:hypothetical protein
MRATFPDALAAQLSSVLRSDPMRLAHVIKRTLKIAITLRVFARLYAHSHGVSEPELAMFLRYFFEE